MYWFGQRIEENFNWQDDLLWSALAPKRKELALTRLDEIISLLDAFSQESFDDALPGLLETSGFSEEETIKTLSLLPGLLKREGLLQRLRVEFIKMEILDEFIKLPHGQFKTKAVPQGTLLHVTAGNVFLSSIDSLLMGLMTKNLSVIKVSSQNKYFPVYFAEKLKAFDQKRILSDKFAILHWKGGDEASENYIKNKVNTIVAWGGEEMISSYKKNLPLHVKFLDFGPKISLQVITTEGITGCDLELIAEKIVADITPWNQGACASPQNLYLQEGIDESLLLKNLEKSFKQARARGSISEDEATEILKEVYRGYYSELMEGENFFQGPEHLVHVEKNKLLRPSPLNRSLIIKRFKNIQELYELLNPFSFYLQSCSYLFGDSEKEEYLKLLALTGIKRFSPLGTVTWGMEGAPHDGRFVLKELVHFIGDETRTQDYGKKAQALTSSADIKDHFESHPHPEGFIFSSGGTTGEPKFVHFSYEEFDYMSDMLVKNFEAQGVRRGMTVANLFVAGNLWSSFICVEKALEKLGTIQLPIGGMCSNENTLFYLKKFSPDIIMGIPSMLVQTAEYMMTKKESLDIPLVFYAGEALSEVRKDFLNKVWNTRYFGSAGYACVDAGVIGYQCRHCGPGEHHLFSDLIELKINDGEAIVSSHIRSSLPIQNYRTGDRIEWIQDCVCGSKDRRFKLLGRTDNLIQVWSCRLLLSDIEACLNQAGIMTFQVQVIEEGQEEKVKIIFESDSEISHESLLLDLYKRSRDVRDTISFFEFKHLIELNKDHVQRNARTGKVSLVVDHRR